MIYTLEQFAYIPFTCIRQIKIVQHWGLHYTVLHDPWFAHQIEFVWPLCLYYIALPLGQLIV